MLHGYLDLPTFAFWDFGNIWTGSVFGEFNYRIFGRKKEDDTKVLCTIVWYGTDCFALVPPEKYVFEKEEEFSPEGLEKIMAFLNSEAEKYKNS